jgi:hypothetical protein
MTRLRENICIILFTAILSFTIILSVAGMLNTERILDYRMQQARQEMKGR